MFDFMKREEARKAHEENERLREALFQAQVKNKLLQEQNDRWIKRAGEYLARAQTAEQKNSSTHQ